MQKFKSMYYNDVPLYKETTRSVKEIMRLNSLGKFITPAEKIILQKAQNYKRIQNKSKKHGK